MVTTSTVQCIKNQLHSPGIQSLRMQLLISFHFCPSEETAACNFADTSRGRKTWGTNVENSIPARRRQILNMGWYGSAGRPPGLLDFRNYDLSFFHAVIATHKHSKTQGSSVLFCGSVSLRFVLLCCCFRCLLVYLLSVPLSSRSEQQSQEGELCIVGCRSGVHSTGPGVQWCRKACVESEVQQDGRYRLLW